MAVRVSFGVISLLSDVVYRHPGRHRAAATPGSATRPWWSVATALVVSVVTGAGEAAGLVLRLGSGVWADRTRRFWGFAAASIAAGTVLPRHPSAPPGIARLVRVPHRRRVARPIGHSGMDLAWTSLVVAALVIALRRLLSVGLATSAVSIQRGTEPL